MRIREIRDGCGDEEFAVRDHLRGRNPDAICAKSIDNDDRELSKREKARRESEEKWIIFRAMGTDRHFRTQVSLPKARISVLLPAIIKH